MDIVLINLGILVAINIVFSLFLYYEKKKRRSNDNDKKTNFSFHFGSQFLASALFPTIIIIVMIADSFFDFIVIYAYFISLVFLSNKLYSKHKNA